MALQEACRALAAATSRPVRAALEIALTSDPSMGVIRGPDPSDTTALLKARNPVDITAITLTANFLRQRDAGDAVSYVINRNINFTNVCVKKCGFCAFSRGVTPEAYWLPPEEIAARAKTAAGYGATEVCVQAGLPPGLPQGHYERICRAIKEAVPGIHIHGFSPEEVLYGAKREGVTVGAMLERLQAAGVGSLPGTSAEILGDEKLRQQLAEGRLSTWEWEHVIRTAHRLGIRTTSTMMFGHAETPEQVAGHLELLKRTQIRSLGGQYPFFRKTRGPLATAPPVNAGGRVGFTEFVPLSFVSSAAPMYKAQQQRQRLQQQARQAGQGTAEDAEDKALAADAAAGDAAAGVRLALRDGPTGLEVLLTHAASRIALSPWIPNIQASWVKEGTRMAQVLLNAGVNDLGGTLMNESISTSAGASHGQLARPSTLRKLARDAGRIPVQRGTLYNVVKVFPGQVSESEAAAESADEPLEAFPEGDRDANTHAFGSYFQLTQDKQWRFRDAMGMKSRQATVAGGCGSGPAGAAAFHSGRSAGVASSRGLHTASSSTSTSTISHASNGTSTPGLSHHDTVTFSPGYTLVPTFECFNACSYCNFRTDVRKGQDEWLSLPQAAWVLRQIREHTWTQELQRQLSLPPVDGADDGQDAPSFHPLHAHHLEAVQAVRAQDTVEETATPRTGTISGTGQAATLEMPVPVSEMLILSGEVSPRSPRRAAWFQRVVELCGTAAAHGFLPHTNVGPLSEQEMTVLRDRNVSMGLMLEQASEALSRPPHGVHVRAPSKRDVSARLEQIALAGRLRIPFTTGILCGIGESADDRVRSLELIAGLADRYGHIGEVIVQPYSPGATSGQGMPTSTMPLGQLPTVVEQARRMLPSNVKVQVPPNLLALRMDGSPLYVSESVVAVAGGAEPVGGQALAKAAADAPGQSLLLACIQAGARDVGGIGPRDEVNPSYPFPLLSTMRSVLSAAGFDLQPRLPLYPRHYDWVQKPKNEGQGWDWPRAVKIWDKAHCSSDTGVR